MKTGVLLVICSMCAGCGGDGPADRAVYPSQCLEADPGELIIQAAAGESWTETVAVHNRCDSDQAFKLLGAGDGFFLDSGVTTIAAGESAKVNVSFRGFEPAYVEGELVLISDFRGELTLPYSGTVSGSRLEIVDDNVGIKAAAGCSYIRRIRLRNTGNVPLAVSSISVSSRAFQIIDRPDTLSIAAGGEAALNLRASPSLAGTLSATLYMYTNAFDQDTVTHLVSVDATFQNSQTLTEPIPPTKFDILLVMDRSTCNMDHLETMPEKVRSLQTELRGWDYRAAVAVADDGCIVGGAGYVDGTIGPGTAEDILVTMTDKDFDLAPLGPDAERGFTLARAALNAVETCNKGVLRDDAFLHIIYESDEPEQTPGPWQDQVAWFDEYKAGRVIHHAVAGPAPDGCPSASASWGLWEAVEETGGVFRSVCDHDPRTFKPTWDKHFEAFGTFIKANADHGIPLVPPAIAGTVAPSVGGALLTEGWSVSRDGSLLTILGSEVSEGGQLEVRYEAVPDICP